LPPHLLSVHLSVLCPPKDYCKIQMPVWNIQTADPHRQQIMTVRLAAGAAEL